MARVRQPTEAECARFLLRLGFPIVRRDGTRVTAREINAKIRQEQTRRRKSK